MKPNQLEAQLRRGGRGPVAARGKSGLAAVFLEFSIFFSEAFDTTGGVHQFLLTGEKWMALGTDFNPDILTRGSSFKFGTAGTLDGRVSVGWMNIGFHVDNPLK
jgi:hypothetical protein